LALFQAFEVSRPRRNEWSHHFCLFSIQFSDNSDTIAGGANDAHLYIYNTERCVLIPLTCTNVTLLGLENCIA
jgi:hypothetical protein